MEMLKSKKWSELFSDVFFLIAGSVLFGVGLNLFLEPGEVVLGGMTGISTTINFFLPVLPIGVGIILLNIPLLIVNLRADGWHAMAKTILGIVVSSVAVDTIFFLPVTMTDPLLCALFGGAVMGAGTGIMLTRGFNTGGTDLAAILLRRIFPRISTGRIILALDFVIVSVSALLTRRPAGLLYSCICVVAYMVVIDFVLGGMDRAKLALIISDRSDEVAAEISRVLDRGLTILHGTGWYTKTDKEVLLCVVKRQQLYDLKKLVKETDREAFLVLADASEVLGKRFKM